MTLPATRASIPPESTELDGLTRTAVLLLALDRDSAASLLRELEPETVERVTATVASLDEVPAALTEAVLRSFLADHATAAVAREGGLDEAARLVRDALEPGEAETVLQSVRERVTHAPFSFLQNAESASLVSFIQDEHPQTVALILSHLPYEQAADILVGLPERRQIEVVRRVAALEPTHADVIREVEQGLEARLASMLLTGGERRGGPEAAAEILHRCDRSIERAILDGIEAEDIELVDDIRRLLFVFEDLLRLSDKGVQSVLKEIDNDELCLALKTASEELKERILSNMSKRAAELIIEDMEYMGPVRLGDVEAAQRRIVDVVRRLEDAGEVYVAGRGSDEEMIV